TISVMPAEIQKTKKPLAIKMTEAHSLLEIQRTAAAEAEAKLVEIDSQLEKYSALEKRLAEVSSRFRSEQLLTLSPGCLAKGTVLHCCEVTIRLGCDYYAETSAVNALKIVQLRCDRLRASRNLFLARQSSAMENCRLLEDLGATEAGGDIREQWTNESEADWAIKHRQAVRQQKIEEREQRVKDCEATGAVDDAKIWARLDELELQEALEEQGLTDKPISKLKSSKSVSFAQPDENDSLTYRPSEPPNAETMRQRTINFRHIGVRLGQTKAADCDDADSPGDCSEASVAPLYTSPADIGAPERLKRQALSQSQAPAVKDRVVEANIATAANAHQSISESNSQRPMSKFRQQRLLGKR
ncbi:hypothetical protein BOX15_Mlig020272g1, partial [Macrostomum lignano]